MKMHAAKIINGLELKNRHDLSITNYSKSFPGLHAELRIRSSVYPLTFDPSKITEAEILSLIGIDNGLGCDTSYMLSLESSWIAAEVKYNLNSLDRELPIGVKRKDCVLIGEILTSDKYWEESIREELMKKEESYWGKELWLSNVYLHEYNRDFEFSSSWPSNESYTYRKVSFFFVPKLATRKEFEDNKSLLFSLRSRYYAIEKIINLMETNMGG